LVLISYPCACPGTGIFFGGTNMETRIAVIGIIVENRDSTEKLNAILHEYGQYIVGRMGIPYPKRQVSIISVVVDAPSDIISALSGKLGMIPHVNIKAVYSKLPIVPDE
jgi:putative iron-only hydrogenase system regulator